MIFMPLENIKEELDRCERLYSNFNEARPFIKAVFKSVYNYFESNPVTPIPAVEEDKATDMIRNGESLELNPEIETRIVVDLLLSISEPMMEANPKLKKTVQQLKEHLEQFSADAPALINKEKVKSLQTLLIKETVLEQDMGTFLFSIMLSSLYRQHLYKTAEVLRTDLWEGGNCPLCGEKPHFGMLRPEDGAKQLECWLCGTRWLHTRIKCPYCNNEEQEDLGYFTVENQEICRINYCQRCCQYYKIIDARKFSGNSVDVALVIHNLATLSHDLLARQEGFKPGSGLEWVNENEIADRED